MAKPQAATTSTNASPTAFPNNGALVQTEGSPVCAIMFQQLIPLPNSAAVSLYGSGFQSLVQIVTASQFNSLPLGQQLDDGACLVSAGGTGAKIGLYTWGQFYWVLNPTIFDQYQFDWDAVVTTPAAVFDEMPQGFIIAE